MQPLHFGWSGILRAIVIILQTLVVTVIRQARHLNPLVCNAVMHGLSRAVQNFHPDMPCEQEMFGKMCPSHSTDCDRFLLYMYAMDIKVHLPLHALRIDDHIDMHRCTHNWQAKQMSNILGLRAESAYGGGIQSIRYRAWMAARYTNLHSARRAGWPIPDWMLHLPKMVPKPAVACAAILPHITYLPKRPYFDTDGSGLCGGRGGGALAICDADTLECKVCPIHCPIRLDHPFAIEMYVVWITLRIRKNLGTQDGTWYTKSDTYRLTIIYLCSVVRL